MMRHGKNLRFQDHYIHAVANQLQRRGQTCITAADHHHIRPVGHGIVDGAGLGGFPPERVGFEIFAKRYPGHEHGLPL